MEFIMDNTLKNEKRILKKVLEWLENKPNREDENFYCDFHIDFFIKKMGSNAEWLSVGIALYSMLQANIKKFHPDLKVMIAFPLSCSHQPRIPKTLSKRNFRKGNYTPPIIYLYSEKWDERALIPGKLSFLPEISQKFQLKAYYSESKEDVYYRTIFMFKE